MIAEYFSPTSIVGRSRGPIHGRSIQGRMKPAIQNYIKMRTPEWEGLYPGRQQIRSQLYRTALKYAAQAEKLGSSTVMEKVTPFSQLSDEIKKFMDKVHEERDRMSRITPLSDEAIRYVSMPPKEPSAS
jgi:hypothetical protein